MKIVKIFVTVITLALAITIVGCADKQKSKSGLGVITGDEAATFIKFTRKHCEQFEDQEEVCFQQVIAEQKEYCTTSIYLLDHKDVCGKPCAKYSQAEIDHIKFACEQLINAISWEED